MKKIIIISDFDGTITERDSLVEILDTFASPLWRRIAERITRGTLGTRIGLKKEFALCTVTKDAFVSYLRENIRLDRTFKPFLGFCRRNGLKFIVVSGGFTLNIRTLFHQYGIRNVRYYANGIRFHRDTARLIFPSSDKSCTTCSHCKAPYLRRYKRKGYFTIYIGDSVTDRCPAKVADLVFAKHDLAKYCRAKGIKYIPYDNFNRIKSHISQAIKKINKD